MKKLTFLFTLALSLHAEDKPAPTVEQLQAQIMVKDQQIAQREVYIQYLENINAAIARKVDACFAAFNSQLQITGVEAQRPPRPAPAKHEALPRSESK